MYICEKAFDDYYEEAGHVLNNPPQELTKLSNKKEQFIYLWGFLTHITFEGIENTWECHAGNLANIIELLNVSHPDFKELIQFIQAVIEHKAQFQNSSHETRQLFVEFFEEQNNFIKRFQNGELDEISYFDERLQCIAQSLSH